MSFRGWQYINHLVHQLDLWDWAYSLQFQGWHQIVGSSCAGSQARLWFKGAAIRLEYCASRKLRKYNQGMGRLLHLGWSNPLHQDRLGTGWQRQTPARFLPYTHIFLFSRLSIPSSLNISLYIVCFSYPSWLHLPCLCELPALQFVNVTTGQRAGDKGKTNKRNQWSTDGSLCTTIPLLCRSWRLWLEEAETPHCFPQPHHWCAPIRVASQKRVRFFSLYFRHTMSNHLDWVAVLQSTAYSGGLAYLMSLLPLIIVASIQLLKNLPQHDPIFSPYTC